MEEERTRALVGECISRAHVEAARGAPLTDITAACDACDYERAATLLLGRARAGEAVPVDTIMRVLPGIELPAITLALVAIAPPSERAKLIELNERRRFPQVRDAGDLEAIVLYAAARAGAATARVIPELRRLSARTLSAESYALLASIAATIDDPNVATATKPIAPFAKEYAKQVAADNKTLAATIDQVLATLPAEIETPRAAGFTVRAQKQVGRNDPCPCGSGLKYKKCCADKDEARDASPSPIAGMSYDEFLGSGAHRMTHEHIGQLSLRELVRVDVSRLGHQSLRAAVRRFIDAHEWPHAQRVLDELGRRTSDESGDYSDPSLRADDDFRYELVTAALDCGEIALVREQVARLPAELAGDFALDLAIADGPERGWQALRDAATRALASNETIPDVDLAYSLLRAEPALGIYFARACIGAMHIDDAETLLNVVEEARDQLNLPPEDPAWAVVDELTERDDNPTEPSTKVQPSLAESTARIDELERKLAAVRTELQHARTQPAAELMRAPAGRSELDDRVRELEGLIREGNAERRELRKQLETAAVPPEPSRREGPRARRATIEEADDDVGDDIAIGARGLTIPRFERRAIDALAAVPANIASETMRTVGTLAAGDGFAWKSVKQAKDMVRPVLMARVGIHHRVLFRVEAGALDVIDVITREQLLTTLKRLRGAR